MVVIASTQPHWPGERLRPSLFPYMVVLLLEVSLVILAG